VPQIFSNRSLRRHPNPWLYSLRPFPPRSIFSILSHPSHHRISFAMSYYVPVLIILHYLCSSVSHFHCFLYSFMHSLSNSLSFDIVLHKLAPPTKLSLCVHLIYHNCAHIASNMPPLLCARLSIDSHFFRTTIIIIPPRIFSPSRRPPSRLRSPSRSARAPRPRNSSTLPAKMMISTSASSTTLHHHHRTPPPPPQLNPHASPLRPQRSSAPHCA